LTFRKYLVLAAVALFASIGDTLLSRGMKDIGNVGFHQLQRVIFAVANPWVFCGVAFLLGFLAVISEALSWADLTFVLPATGLGYAAMALAARFFLHEQISPSRWAGIALIVVGVGFVASGPSRMKRVVTPLAESAPIAAASEKRA
jgi:drug/metabolite transporter (DMT)-like permease